jgi:hypothetical protein
MQCKWMPTAPVRFRPTGSMWIPWVRLPRSLGNCKLASDPKFPVRFEFVVAKAAVDAK